MPIGTDGGWFEGTSTFVDGSGLLSDVTKYTLGAATLGINLNSVLRSKIYMNGWGGNQFVWAGKIGVGAELAGHSLLVGSIAVDVYGYATGQVSDLKLSADLTMDAVGYFGGPIGAGISGAYYVGDTINTYYPNAFPTLLRDYSNTIQTEQANGSLFWAVPGKIAFRPNMVPGALPSPRYKRKKRNREVINSYDVPLDCGQAL